MNALQPALQRCDQLAPQVRPERPEGFTYASHRQEQVSFVEVAGRKRMPVEMIERQGHQVLASDVLPDEKAEVLDAEAFQRQLPQAMNLRDNMGLDTGRCCDKPFEFLDGLVANRTRIGMCRSGIWSHDAPGAA